MKIVWCDNFDREGPGNNERVVAYNINSEREAKAMLQGLLVTCPAHGSDWYKIVPDDYRLRVFRP